MNEYEKKAWEIVERTCSIERHRLWVSRLREAIAAALDEAVKAETERCINLIATAMAKTRGEAK